MYDQQHIIQKVKLNVHCSDEEKVLHFQNQFKEAFQKEVLPGLEKLFEAQSDENEIIRIKQLNIDLGNIKEKSNPKEIARILFLEIKRAR